ncbi:Voldacs domain-containing protein [Mycobacteroides abscessus]|uniref:Voldacs domain-containing protein n=1 Tax=Mycobacteroides abscessus TaxID=36809 RepID=UPI0011C448F3|nr:Voldacs domain-containing protein [Mycobacteroides abscessus]
MNATPGAPPAGDEIAQRVDTQLAAGEPLEGEQALRWAYGDELPECLTKQIQELRHQPSEAVQEPPLDPCPPACAECAELAPDPSEDRWLAIATQPRNDAGETRHGC